MKRIGCLLGIFIIVGTANAISIEKKVTGKWRVAAHVTKGTCDTSGIPPATYDYRLTKTKSSFKHYSFASGKVFKGAIVTDTHYYSYSTESYYNDGLQESCFSQRRWDWRLRANGQIRMRFLGNYTCPSGSCYYKAVGTGNKIN